VLLEAAQGNVVVRLPFSVVESDQKRAVSLRIGEGDIFAGGVLQSDMKRGRASPISRADEAS
jgi:hypothetical protein